MASNHDKNVKYVGDSRVKAERTPNIPKDYSEFPGKTEAFWPDFLLKEWMVGAVVLIGFLILTVAHESPLQTIADPTDTAYIPVPDWYFLFLYQLLKYTYASGPYNILGTIVIPGIAFGGLLLAPWIDQGPERRPTRRPIATASALLAVIAIFYLTWEAADAHDWSQNERYAYDNQIVIDTTAVGYEIFASQMSCMACHGDNLGGTASGPAINQVGAKYSAEEIHDIIVNGIEADGDGPGMPGGQFTGTDDELDILVEWLASLGAEAGDDANDGGH